MTLHVYMDESGTHDDAAVMVIGGYIFEEDEADRFAQEWSAALTEYGLPYAHQTDCATGNGVYKGMNVEKRIEIQTRLIKLIRSCSLHSFCVVSDPVWLRSELDSDGIPALARTSNYEMLVIICLTIINEWVGSKKYQGLVSYFLEAGHRNQREVNRVFELVAREDMLKAEMRYASHCFADKFEAVPLQAADMVAWQAYHYWSRRIRHGIVRERADYRALNRSTDSTMFVPITSFPPMPRSQDDPLPFTD